MPSVYHKATLKEPVYSDPGCPAASGKGLQLLFAQAQTKGVAEGGRDAQH
jgi:hypothetical protein